MMNRREFGVGIAATVAVAALPSLTVASQEPIYLGVDVARFGNESTVFVARQGASVLWVNRWKGLDTVSTAKRAAYMFDKIQAQRLVINGQGISCGVIDCLRFWGYPVIETRLHKLPFGESVTQVVSR